MPRRVWARSFSVTAVDIDAVVTDDGTLQVEERRTYRFSGSFQGIYWDVPRGVYDGRNIDTTIDSVSAEWGGQRVTFSAAPTFLDSNLALPGTYEQTEGTDCWHLKLYWPWENQTATVQVTYEMPQLAARWADTAELYWQYVPADTSSDEWHNVTATVHLPVPSGARVVPGENVHAWGHGPLDGDVFFEGGTVRFTSPGVGGGEYLEGRIAFPQEWLSRATMRDEARLDTILAEEAQWAKLANRTRFWARLGVYGLPIGMVLTSVLSVVASHLYLRQRSKRQPKSTFNDKYYREIPSQDHPAVLGMLYRDGKLSGVEFSATLMRLTDQGRVALDTVQCERAGGLKKAKPGQEWRLLRKNAPAPPRAKQDEDVRRIDTAAFNFLFDVVGDKHRHTIDPELLGPAGEPYVLSSFFKETAKGWPGAYEAGYNKWADAVREAYDKRGFSRRSKSDDVFPGIIGIVDFVLFATLGIVGIFAGTPSIFLMPALLAFFVAGIYIVFLDDAAPAVAYSQEAIDLRAKLEGLKRWLTDFTHLEEAIPNDIVLWNQLLVMAAVLGVADKVVEQLRVHAPHIVANPAFGTLAWYDADMLRSMDPPDRVFARSVEEGGSTSYAQLHHEVSSYDVASSHDSSSRGSSGGFSGSSSGGGGFSGGGRGGAF